MSKIPFNFALAKAGVGTLRFAAGEVIFREGDAGDSMYYILSGKVAIEVRGKALFELEEGNLFGEMALLDGSKRSATVRCVEACDVSEIDEETFLKLVDEASYISLDIMRMMAARLRRANELI